jgi:hypothetical protein
MDCICIAFICLPSPQYPQEQQAYRGTPLFVRHDVELMEVATTTLGAIDHVQ